MKEWAGRLFVVAVIGGSLWGVFRPSYAVPMIPEERQFYG